MVTGSFASSFHGTPRASQDIDFVVDPSPEQLMRLERHLPSGEYYMAAGAAMEALRRRGMFNIIDLSTGWKADLIIRKDRPFSREEFRRRRSVEVAGMRLTLASPEDVILSKLEWANAGQSTRQIEDAAGILRLRSMELDHEYLRRWIHELGLEEPWDAARRAAGMD